MKPDLGSRDRLAVVVDTAVAVDMAAAAGTVGNVAAAKFAR